MPNKLISDKVAFWLIFLAVTTVLLGASLWVVSFVRGSTVEANPPRVSTGYVNYFADGSVGGPYYTAEADAAVKAYIEEFPEPQNVQVLVGYNTSQIWGYMVSLVAGGLQVNCTYCHSLENFGWDEDPNNPDAEWPARKANARLHLQMTADLNQNWISALDDVEGKQRSGAQIICATCHNGQAQPVSWPDELHALPNDYRLPLRAEDGSVGTVADIDRQLNITGNDEDYSLDAAQYNQNTMYHMNESLGVGCTHCHNSRYFPSWEQPAKYYAYTMLQMNQHILSEYSESMGGQEPSCWLCHRNQVRPPGSMTDEAFLPEPLRTTYEP